jgi:hypothetical protein
VLGIEWTFIIQSRGPRIITLTLIDKKNILLERTLKSQNFLKKALDKKKFNDHFISFCVHG